MLLALPDSSRLDEVARHAICRALQKTAGATPRDFWADERPKSGVAPALFCSSLSGTFGFWLLGDCCKHKDWNSRWGEDLVTQQGEECTPYLLHRLVSGSGMEKIRARTSSTACRQLYPTVGRCAGAVFRADSLDTYIVIYFRCRRGNCFVLVPASRAFGRLRAAIPGCVPSSCSRLGGSV